MRSILMTIGLPGSGKSTYAKELLRKEPNRWKRINRDDLRMMNDNRLFSPGEPEREMLITREMLACTRSCLRAGKDVILDNTNLQGKARKVVHDLAQEIGDVTVIEKVIQTPLKTVMLYNKMRELHETVDESVILGFAKRYHLDNSSGAFKNIKDRQVYYPPHVSSRIIQDPALPSAIICDLDGTLAIIDHRNPYDASTCDEDELNVPVATLLRAMQAQEHKIIFMSGRDEKFREPTLRFFEKNIPDVAYEGLFMRKSGDVRKDSIIKRELFEENVQGKYYVNFIVDDRPQVVRMWRHDLGLTVLQLDDREF